MDKKEIAKIILFHRKKSGLSRVELAELAGIGKTSVFDIESGKKDFRIDTFYAVCRVLNIDIVPQSSLMEEYEKNTDKEK